jgi:hypothetical protein
MHITYTWSIGRAIYIDWHLKEPNSSAATTIHTSFYLLYALEKADRYTNKQNLLEHASSSQPLKNLIMH